LINETIDHTILKEIKKLHAKDDEVYAKLIDVGR